MKITRLVFQRVYQDGKPARFEAYINSETGAVMPLPETEIEQLELWIQKVEKRLFGKEEA